VGGARISAQDGATLRLEPAGMVTVICSVTEQGQGTEGIFAQIAASVVGVSLEKIKVITGDTGVTPYGGGTWASRGAGIGGEAVLQAGRALVSNILDIASKILNVEKETLTIENNAVVSKLTQEKKLPLEELGRVAYFRPDTLPMDFQSELTVTRHYTPREYGFTFTNGIQASLVEVDADTGFVRLLKHWCVEDSGTVINPMLVDEQLRGGVVQGHRRGALRGVPLTARRAAAQRQHGGLPGANGGRDARHHLRARRDPDQAVAAGRQRRGRGRHRGRARRGDERDQRRARAAERARDGDALHAGENFASLE
jgi:CO/xanthine dehydrogenase Mo-binding subunit